MMEALRAAQPLSATSFFVTADSPAQPLAATKTKNSTTETQRILTAENSKNSEIVVLGGLCGNRRPANSLLNMFKRFTPSQDP